MGQICNTPSEVLNSRLPTNQTTDTRNTDIYSSSSRAVLWDFGVSPSSWTALARHCLTRKAGGSAGKIQRRSGYASQYPAGAHAKYCLWCGGVHCDRGWEFGRKEGDLWGGQRRRKNPRLKTLALLPSPSASEGPCGKIGRQVSERAGRGTENGVITLVLFQGCLPEVLQDDSLAQNGQRWAG